MTATASAASPSDAPLHGGALDRAARRYGIPRAAWVDLSTGINPWPYPVPALPTGLWQRLPDDDLETALLTAAAGYLGRADAAALVPTPGSQAAIQLLPRLLPQGRVAILGFTYAEHARCWRLAGHEVVPAPAEADADWCARAGCRHAVVTNPNNPTGERRSPDALLAVARALAARGGRLIVDEAFADVDPALSLAAAAAAATEAADGPVVLRSFGKFFGLAGLRLGLIVADQPLIRAIRSAQGPWAVSGPALAVGAAAYADSPWIAATRTRLADAAAALMQAVGRAGLEARGGTDLFQLFTVPAEDAAKAADRTLRLYERCARAGLLLRRFPDRPDWLRIGLPPNDAARERLAALVGAD